MLLALIHIVMKYELNKSYRNTKEFISYQNVLISEHLPCKVLTCRGWELQPGHTSYSSLLDVGNRSLPALLLWTPTTRSQPENNENGLLYLSSIYLSMCIYVYIGREREREREMERERERELWNSWLITYFYFTVQSWFKWWGYRPTRIWNVWVWISWNIMAWPGQWWEYDSTIGTQMP